MADEPEEIDFEQIVWDPRYRRSVIERLNRSAGEAGKSAPAQPSDEAQLESAPRR